MTRRASPLTGDELSLGAIQRWMQLATTHPAGLAAGLELARQGEGVDIGAVIATPAGIDPHRRLAVYADGYWLRLIGCLEAEFSALLRLLGPSLFQFFARAYLSVQPSRSPTLHRLGAGFPAFLLRSQRQAKVATQRPATQTFALALATLERAIAESGRAYGVEGKSVVPVDAFSLLAAGNAYRIALPATTRLIALRHPVDSLRVWLRGQGGNAPPVARRDYAAIRRHQFRVSLESLADWQFFALRHLARRPASLADCARAAARRTGLPESELVARLAFWLPGAQFGSLVILTPL
ncbi:DNA-binding domain-containing protein [Pseudomonas oryzihabitans]|uniref:DNA-binding domain-containing protein n=1 Tax=Pseudomonas oryzihabitans TaxID=47885 RepID=UPI002854A347|nr:DNA-binding domain-containing protein [Pseudomonas psychrotolerans]MDR6679610.1 hypothetical protein [Pseudomonas psychrotolerans]